MARRVAFVTGAGSGIGLATSRLLALSGYDLLSFDLRNPPLEKIASELESDGEKVIAVDGDVASEEDMDRAVRVVGSEFGRLDAIVANVGINGVWAPIDDLSPDEWDATIRVNLRGTFLTLNRMVPLLKEAGRGSIVIVSSINGVRTFTNPGATAPLDKLLSNDVESALGFTGRDAKEYFHEVGHRAAVGSQLLSLLRRRYQSDLPSYSSKQSRKGGAPPHRVTKGL